jgi:hypothetical protein
MMGVKDFGRTLVVSAVMAGAGYLAYTYAVPAEKKAELESRVGEIRSHLHEFMEVVGPYVDQVAHPAPADHSNKEATIRQWESLGY